MNNRNSIKVGSPLMYKMNTELQSPMKLIDCNSNTFVSPNQCSQEKISSDRFIPNRVSSNLYNLFMCEDASKDILQGGAKYLNPTTSNTANGNGASSNNNNNSSSVENFRDEQNSLMYSNLLQSQILGQMPNCENLTHAKQGLHTPQVQQKKILKFKSDRKNNNTENNPGANFSFSPIQVGPEPIISSFQQNTRKIPQYPYKVLDAPSLQDDFYLNLLDWSSLNYIGVGLENSVYIWSACNSKVNKLCELPENDSVCSVSWSQRGNHLAVGNSFGQVQIYDVAKGQSIRTIEGHTGRVGSLAWNGYLLASGSRDRNILVRDVRTPDTYEYKYSGHKQQICGLRWSFDEQTLASGGNDNKLFLWSVKTHAEMARFSQHSAAVKALGFSPHQHNILATGGGTADRCIRFWNTHTLQQIDCIDTGSQVCNLMFSKNVNEIVSTHGYSLNQIIAWQYPSMQQIATLTGHTYRVLYLAMSPCGQNIVTGAGDETLRFWSVFPQSQAQSGSILGPSSLCPSNLDLR